jgi:pimeloyl-ACP methyl ester carboxylesterase
MTARSNEKTILVCHGAWSGGWSWKKMFPLVEAAGYRMMVPTYTGLGEREHLANPAIDLETHIQDILSAIKFEDLNDIILLGHSYGGMVATGVADRVRDRISQLIYLDAFVPRDGQSLFDLNEAGRPGIEASAKNGDGWRAAPLPTPPDTAAEDLDWITPRRVPMPLKCFQMKLKLQRGEPAMPRSYIYAKRITPADTFGQFSRRAQSEPGWHHIEIDASHAPNISAPDKLMGALHKLLD